MAGLKKVLFVINTLGTAGAEKSLLELLGRLRGRSVELSLYVLTSQGELAGQLPEGVRLLNSKYYDVPVRTGQDRAFGGWQRAL